MCTRDENSRAGRVTALDRDCRSSRRFEWEDQVRLAEWLAGHPGPVALSNQATGRVIDLYTRLGFALDYLDAPRRISCTGDRTPAREVLALRNLSGPGALPARPER